MINITMEANSCWYELDIDTSTAFKQGYTLPAVNGKDVSVLQVPTDDIFDPTWIGHLSAGGIDITDALLFWRPSWFTNEHAHIDGVVNQSAVTGLNWVIGGKDSEMSWYHIPPGPTFVEYTKAGTAFSSWLISDLVERDRRRIQERMTLVRVDVPHAIFVKEEPRWCISLRTNHPGLTWEDRVSFMREKGLILDGQ